MRRREILTLAGGVMVVQPLALHAQPAKVPTVGVLVVSAPGSDKFWRLFRDDMRRLGYIDGQTVRYEFRPDQGQLSRLPELAAELVRLKVDVIVVWLTPAALAAKQITRDIPIVMAVVGNPEAVGLVDSLARPGGNVTGMSGMAAELSGKGVEILREILPSTRRVAALTNAPDPFSKPLLERIRQVGVATSTTIVPVPVNNAAELEEAFATMEKERVDGVIAQASLPTRRIAELALKHRLPSMSVIRAFPEQGGLMAYVPEEADLYQRAASIVDKVLKGARPADLPVEQSTRFELVINLTTAKAIGLAVPTQMLQRADEVIE
jgi:putative tryptophan/tyrosine transport system substrate-binding protein